MDKRASLLGEISLERGEISLERGEISLERGEISLTRMKISPYINTYKRAAPAAGMKVQRCRRKLFLTTVKTTFFFGKRDEIFSYINSGQSHPA